MELDKKIVGQRRMLELFHDFSSFDLSIPERERFLEKYVGFSYIGSLIYSQGRLRNNLVIADKARMKSVGLSPEKIKSNKFILDLLKSDTKFQIANLTEQTNNPMVALVLRPRSNRAIIGVLPQNNLLDYSGNQTGVSLVRCRCQWAT